ncbi:uncharacterized protein FIBRA_03525 [Fibroporia radiculosa]|uniref:Homeobox domain-containing protein n=1 Tax=Fibroporia radiculosa TaxID=599839 RepID=J4I9N5_9APHY|nr:uncharacterized protein FIBRA_03525 [Fibroporia radiculosa]CCM01471.1 predicted protein [Fibroporia radiculosa]
MNMPNGRGSEYLIAENHRRIPDENFHFSLKLEMSNHPDDHFSYGCFSRTPRRSPAGGTNNNGGSARRGFFHMGQGGRAQLPPLHLPFRASRSPGPFSFNTPNNQQEHQVRNDYGMGGAYGQQGWPVNPPSGHHQQTSFQSDPRLAAQAQYGSYPHRTPSAMIPDTSDPRTLPPLNMPHSQAHPGASGQHMVGGTHIRSPIAGYPPSYAPYPEQPQPSGSFLAPDPRNLPPPVPSMGLDPSANMMPRRASMSVDRSAPSRLSVHGPSPYPRNPSVTSPSAYIPDDASISEPAIKKKRKRADAEQLKVLNETYNRTAFPSTEERAELAKRLNMSARSVQIWFQNKRQAMRQSSRQAQASAPPSVNDPFASASHAGAAFPAPGSYGAPSSSSVNMGQPYGAMHPGDVPHRTPSRLIPSPTPSAHHRGRSHEGDDRDPRRFSGRPF